MSSTDQSQIENKTAQTIKQKDLLNHIDHASHYVGGEINQVRKHHDHVRLKIALAFPDAYEIGMSHFGIQILYQILNQRQEVAAERVFAPSIELEAELRDHELPLVSLESQVPLNRFDLIGFSLLYELNYTNVLQMLDLSRIPLRASERNAMHPLIVAGGPCCFNPEPIAPAFDAMVIGDGEVAIGLMCDAWLEWQSKETRTRSALLLEWSRIEGVYVPSLYTVAYQNGQIETIDAQEGVPQTVPRSVLSDLDRAPFPDHPVVPFGKPVHDRLRLEVSRGCSRSCRFCQAGIIYRPVRERSFDNLLSLTQSCLCNTGYEDISLLSLSTGDYSELGPLIQALIRDHQKKHVAISLPSIRADRLDGEIMNLIKKVRKTGFTIAPEAGSQRLRNIINKNISEDDIINAVEGAFGLGWRIIKLYFMIGLPGETPADIEAIVTLVKKIKKHCQQQRFKGQINVSVSTFIPKAHTPFQWEQQIDYETSKEIIFDLKRKLNLPGVGFKWQQPQISRLEGLWSRGDRRLFPLLETAFAMGCRFDGWSDHFDAEKWQSSMQQTGIAFEEYLRSRSLTETLPWSHIDSRVSHDFLKTERSRAYAQDPTLDCRNSECHQCGICDFDDIFPRLHTRKQVAPAEMYESRPTAEGTPYYKKVSLRYIKMGPAKYFGHLELINIFTRAFRRLNFDIQFSQGFHPKAKIVFEDALPVGIESICEHLKIGIDARVNIENLKKDLNKNLPKGLRVLKLTKNKIKPNHKSMTRTTYLVYHPQPVFDVKAVQAFKDQAAFIVEKKGKKGQIKELDLQKVVHYIDILSSKKLKIVVDQGDQSRVRPRFVIEKIFQLDQRSIERARMVKLNTDQIAMNG